jgi:hypothetical protein
VQRVLVPDDSLLEGRSAMRAFGLLLVAAALSACPAGGSDEASPAKKPIEPGQVVTVSFVYRGMDTEGNAYQRQECLDGAKFRTVRRRSPSDYFWLVRSEVYGMAWAEEWDMVTN